MMGDGSVWRLKGSARSRRGSLDYDVDMMIPCKKVKDKALLF